MTSQHTSNVPVVTVSQLKLLVKALITREGANKHPIGVLGDTGGGKTSAMFQACIESGFKREEILIINPGNYTITDFIGVPDVVDGKTVFSPPEWVWKLSTGEIKVIIWDEFTDTILSIQNVLAAAMLEGRIDRVYFHPELIQLWTGNRVQDRAGSNDLNRKISTRSQVFELGRSVDNWVAWGIENEMPRSLLAFVMWKGEEALYGKEDANPRDVIRCCPRQVAEVGSNLHARDAYPNELLSLNMQSIIPNWWVVEYGAFEDIFADLPPIPSIKNNPETAPISEKIGVTYALVSRIITETENVGDFQQFMRYISRLRVEPQTLYVNAIIKQVPEIRSTKEYCQWAMTNSPYFVDEE